jgi:hypothetical protein
MPTVKRFEDLDVWKTARELNRVISDLIEKGNFRNNSCLINQIFGSAGSVMDNIAEGFERGSTAEFMLFLGYAKGSCGELRSQLHRSLDSGYITQDDFQKLFELTIRVSHMSQKLMSYLKCSGLAGSRKKFDSKNIKKSVV